MYESPFSLNALSMDTGYTIAAGIGSRGTAQAHGGHPSRVQLTNPFVRRPRHKASRPSPAITYNSRESPARAGWPATFLR
ncbi:hypothetical protein EVAR_9078_1 [Eumeta japonica]|uniref:Uncharacterized protein n=1 Tax=Eumeta variegata TaxID=151549 RepID=A0A4C1TX65_EUMVA|nr:hypothetical protein EVAR_9078_1 [Eumeta japonica]